MTNLGPVNPGDPIARSAAVHNELLKQARNSRRLPLNTPPRETQKWSPQDVLLIKNDSGQAIEMRYAIVGLKEPVFLPSLSANAEYTFREQTVFKGDWPATSANVGSWGVLQQPLGADAPNDVGIAIVGGTCIALVESSVVVGDSVDVSDSARLDENVLQPVSGGCATVLWCGDVFDASLPDNVKWALIRFGGGGGGGAEIVHFEITAYRCIDVDDHGHHYATASVTHVACGLSSPAVGDSIEIYDIMGCWLTMAEQLAVGLRGTAVKMAHEEIYGEDCTWSITALCGASVGC